MSEERKIRKCPGCKTAKPLTPEFYNYQNKAKGTFCGYCKVCRSRASQHHYRKPEVKERHARRYRELQNRIVKAKSDQGFKCASCQRVCEEKELDFAHIDAATKYKRKNGKPHNIIALGSIKAIEAELPKGRFLCIKCHKIESASHTAWETDNTTHKKEKRRAVNDEKLKRGQCACGCGIKIEDDLPTTLQCFEFDHVDPKCKIEGVSDMVGNAKFSVDDLRVEMAKCALLYAACHRKKSAAEAKSRAPRKSVVHAEEWVPKGRAPKISAETAKLIKDSKGTTTRKARAERFGVSSDIVANIDNGKTWKDV
jgi:hypothetical protein